MVIEPGGGRLEPVKGPRIGNERCGEFRPCGKSEQRHPVAALERHIGSSERGRNRAVDPGLPCNGLAHRLPAIEGENDLVVAFAFIFLGIEMRMAGAGFPVDPAAVHPRLVLGQRLELGAFAANPPGDQAELGIAQEGLKCRRAQRGDIGRDPHACLHRA